MGLEETREGHRLDTMANIIIGVNAQGDPCKLTLSTPGPADAQDKVAASKAMQAIARASSAGRFPKISGATASENKGR